MASTLNVQLPIHKKTRARIAENRHLFAEAQRKLAPHLKCNCCGTTQKKLDGTTNYIRANTDCCFECLDKDNSICGTCTYKYFFDLAKPGRSPSVLPTFYCKDAKAKAKCSDCGSGLCRNHVFRAKRKTDRKTVLVCGDCLEICSDKYSLKQ